MRGIFHRINLCLLLAFAFGTDIARAGDSPADATNSVLYLNDGDFFRGTLADGTSANALRWQAWATIRPFEFPVDSIGAAYFTSNDPHPVPAGDYCVELTGGDVLYAALMAITPEVVELNSARFGSLTIARAEVRRLTRIDAAASIYRGPNGVQEWTKEKWQDKSGRLAWRTSSNSGWMDEAGRLVTRTRGATINHKIPIPNQARIEFEISWESSPQFVLSFCTAPENDQGTNGFRLETWERRLVLIRELDQSADVALVAELDPQADRIHFEASCDFDAATFAVLSLDGKQLAQVKLPKMRDQPIGCVWLVNNGKNLRLEQLSVSKWNGQTTLNADGTKPLVKTRDALINGSVIKYTANDKQFTIQTESGEQQLNGESIECIVFPSDKGETPGAFRLCLAEGSRLSGDILKVETGNVYLRRRGVEQPIICAAAHLRSLVSLKEKSAAPATTKDRIGRLEVDGILSSGSIVSPEDAATAPSETATCFAWQPRTSTQSSPLRAGIAGRVVYHETPPPREPTEEEKRAVRLRQQQQQAVRRRGFVDAVAGIFRGDVPMLVPKANGSGTLCLVTGDRVPCESVTIDAEGIHFSSSLATSHLVPHCDAKAIEFISNWTAAALAEEKRLRLLTLPRMQKTNPPTHLVVSTSGDFLRGRLQSLSAETLALETRLETKQIPRNRVACIIWLPDTNASASPPTPANADSQPLRIQAVKSDGVRLTFAPRQFADAALAGVSSALGECRVALNSVDQLLFGAMIKEVAEKQLYGDWKLSHAKEPQFAQEPGSGGDPAAGSGDSMLVGKPAPDIKLALLDGGEFNLGEQKGNVVVLDFWASWCGPCMQAMPQTEAVVAEFKDRKVKLFAVNMQEDETAIKSALERLKLHPAVVLDIDGAAAERYHVSAIPQVVVIDISTNVAEVLVGANPGFAEQLRNAIEKSLAQRSGSQ